MKKNTTFLIGLIIILIIVLCLLIIPNKKEIDSIEFYLYGDNFVNINLGENYIDTGVIAKNNKGEDLSNQVIINNTVDINKVGSYVIFYKLKDKTIYRYVNVIDSPDNLQFDLLGDSSIKLNYKEEYKEPGVNAIDKIDGNLNKEVEVLGFVDTTTVGEYTLTYTVGNSRGYQKKLTRTITVVDTSERYNIVMDLLVSNKNLTNKEVQIQVNVEGESYKFLKLPDGTATKEKNVIFKVSQNGKYKFTAYNDLNKEFEKEISISNIDMNPPVGSCQATLTAKNTTINVNASDNNKVVKYVYYDSSKLLNTLTSKTYTHNGKTSKNIIVKVYDSANNIAVFNCSIIDNTY